MNAAIRPRRSVLYMPGANARALDKARTLHADALILHLEDAVAPDAKAQAREQVAAALRAGGYGRRECVVRINALDTAWGHDDVRAIAPAGADAVLLPKVQSAAELAALAQALDAAGAPASRAFATRSSASSRSARAFTLSATRRASEDLSVRLMLSMLGEPDVV